MHLVALLHAYKLLHTHVSMWHAHAYTQARTHKVQWYEPQFINNCCHTCSHNRNSTNRKKMGGLSVSSPRGRGCWLKAPLSQPLLVHTDSLGSDRAIPAWGHSLNNVYWKIIHLMYDMCVVLHFLSWGSSLTFIYIYTVFLCNVNILLWWVFIVKIKQRETTWRFLSKFCF